MYCDINSILNYVSSNDLGQLSNDSGAVYIDGSIVDNAIKNAEDEINGYLRGRYSLPLNPVPVKITQICADIAIYSLSKRRNAITETIRKSYEDAVSDLSKIQKGNIILFDEVNGETPAVELKIIVEDKTPIFSSKLLKGFRNRC